MTMNERLRALSPRRHRFALEARQLFDGAAVTEAAHHADADTLHHDSVAEAPKAITVAPPAPKAVSAAPAEVYVVDSHIQNWQSLVSQLPQGSKVVVLNDNSSGLDQINKALQGSENIQAIHILSHGASDTLGLGSDTLTAQNLAKYSEQLNTLGSHLSADGDILLYGCDISSRDTALVTRIASLTQADVASSTDMTGSAALGGDWVLESHIGTVDTRSLALDYDRLLDVPEVRTSSSGLTVSEPTVLNPGAERGQLSGWQVTATDDSVTVSISVRDTTLGSLSDGTHQGSTLSFTGTAAQAQSWLNSLTFTAADIETGKTSASTFLDVHISSESGTSTSELGVTITPANDPTTVADSTVSVSENGTTTLGTDALNAQDSDVAAGGQTWTQVVYELSAMPQYGYLTLNGQRLGVGSVFTQQDVINGQLKYVHTATGATQNNSDNFTAVVNDGATPASDSDTVTVTLNVAPVNQPPTVSGEGLVYEGQPANATDTGNVGQYITADGGGDPQDTNLTLTITSLPTHGTLYFRGQPVSVGQTFSYADKQYLTYQNYGEEGVTQDDFGIRVTDNGGGTGTPASSDGVIKLDVRPVNDEPVIDPNMTSQGAVDDGSATLVLTPGMINATDVDSSPGSISFIVDTTNMTHGYLTVNGERVQNGDSFTMQDVLDGNVVYHQYADADFDGQQDSFDFVVIDHSETRYWDSEGNPHDRNGGIWDGTEPDSSVTHFRFNVDLIDTTQTNGQLEPPPADVPVIDPQVTIGDPDYFGDNVNNPGSTSHGSFSEGGTLTLSGDSTNTTNPGMTYTVSGIPENQVVYTFEGFNTPGLTLQKSDSNGGWITIQPYGTFTQADLNDGLIRIVHDGNETFHFQATFSVSAGLVGLDSNGNPLDDAWHPVIDIYVTPVNDAPDASGTTQAVIKEGDTLPITSGLISITDPDDANSGSPWETSPTLDGNTNYALNNEASGADALKFVLESLPQGGSLQYLSNGNWVTLTQADIGNTQLDLSLLTASAGTTGLRFVSNGGETRSTSFTVSAIDRWGAVSSGVATVNIVITNVNDGPTIAPTPDGADPVVPPDSPNNIGGPPANNPLSVVEGSYGQITNGLLQAYDPDSTADQVQFTITSVPTQGRLLYSTDGVHFSTIGVGSSFTQQDINSGYIWYVNNGTEGNTTDGFNFTLSDGNKEQTNVHFAINQLPANDPPAVSGPSAPVNVGGDTPTNVPGFSLSDPDLSVGAGNVTDNTTVIVRLLHSDGSAFSQADYGDVTLAINAASGVTGTPSVHGGYLVFSGTVAQINAALASLTVAFSTDHNEQYQLQVIADDRLRNPDGSLSGSANGGPVNQPNPIPGNPLPVDANTYNWYADKVPANDGNITASSVVIRASQTDDPGNFTAPTSANALEDQNSPIGRGQFVVSDVESNAFNLPVTVTLTVAQGTLGIGGNGSQTTVNGVTITGDNTGTLVLTGVARDIEALLNDSSLGLTYKSALNANQDQNGAAAGDVTINMHMDTSASHIGSDAGPAPADQQIAVTIGIVNDAPTVTPPNSTIIQLQNGTPGGNNVPGFSVGDVDVSDAGGIQPGESDQIQVTIRLTDDNGVPLSLIQYRDLQNSAVTITSTNAASSGVTIQSTSVDGNPPYNGDRMPLVIRGTVAQINAFLAGLQVQLTGIQVDNMNDYLHVEVIADDRARDANGNLIVGADANGGPDNASGGVGTVAPPSTEVNPFAAVPGGLTQNVTVGFVRVFQNSTNDPARVTLGDNPALTANEGSATVNLPAINVDDIDALNDVIQVDVTLANGFVFSSVGGSGGTLTGVGTGHITLTGTTDQINSRLASLVVQLPDVPGSATAADWNGAFGVTVVVNDLGNSGGRPSNIDNQPDDPNADPGAVSYQDGTSAALVTTREFTFTVNPVNDAPVVNGSLTQTLPAVSEDSAASSLGGSSVTSLFLSKFDDSKDLVSNSGNGATGGTGSDGFFGVAITQLTPNAAQGVWQYSLDNGASWVAVGARSDSNALILNGTALIRFVPAANFFGTPTTLGVRLVEANSNNDQTSTTTEPTNGATFNIGSNHGGTSRFSDGVIVLSTSVTGVNDRPTLGVTNTTINEDSPQTNQTIGQLLQTTWSDKTDDQSSIAGGGKADGALQFVAITGNSVDSSKGHWEYSLNGTTWLQLPTGLSDSRALVLSSSTLIRFVPLADYNGPVSGGLTVRGSDSNTSAETGVSSPGDIYTLTNLDTATSHWSNSNTIGISITPVQDAFNDEYTIHANNTLVKTTADLLANDTFENAGRQITAVTQPQHGTLTFVNGVLTYKPSQGYVGDDSYVYTVTSGGVTETATVTIHVTNTVPAPAADLFITPEDTPFTDNVLNNDTDADGDPLTVTSFTLDGQSYAAGTLVTLANNRGTMQLNADGTFNYTPVGDWHGVVGLSYVVSDGNNGGQKSANIGLIVTPVQDIVNDASTTHAGLTVTTDVLANDTFSNPDQMVTAVSQGTHGTVTIGANNQVIYTPDAGFVGTDTYTYTVTSGGVTERGTVFINVTNTEPTADNIIVSTPEDTPVSGNLLARIQDPDGDPIQVTDFTVNGQTYQAGQTITLAGYGALTIQTNGNWQFIPVADWNGTVPHIDFTVSDGNDGGTNSSSLDITVTPVADIANDSATVHAGKTLTLTPLANDSFENSNAAITALGTPQHGSVVQNGNQLIYTPAAGFVGRDTFTYTVTSGGVTETATITIDVVNIAPTVTPLVVSTVEDTPLNGSVLGNAIDSDGDSLSVSNFTINGTTVAAGSTVQIAGQGAFTLNANGSYTFTPLGDWHGTVSGITFTVSDGSSNGAVSNTLSITVTPAQDAYDDMAATHAGTAVDIDVLENDTFSNSDRTVSLPQNSTALGGTVSVDANGIVHYEPPAGVPTGQDTFTYTVTSGGVTETATVTVYITNATPVVIDAILAVQEDHTLTDTIGTLDQDTDVVRFTGFSINGTRYDIPGAPGDLSGSAFADISGVGRITITANHQLTFVPAADWNGLVPTVTIFATDDTGAGEVSGKVFITVLPVADIVNDSITTHAGTPVTSNLLANDTFEASNPQITGVTQPGHGSVSIVNNQVVYTPTAGYVGNDTYTYTVTSGGVTETATVTVTVTNIPPVGVPDVSSGNEDTVLSGNVLSNDTDANNDTLRVTSFQLPGETATHPAGSSVLIAGKGTIIVNSDGTWSFSPVADWNGVVPTITYNLSDGNTGGTSSSTLDLTVIPVADIVPDTISTHSGVSILFNPLRNDTFENSDRTITATSNGSWGTVTIENGQLRYTPAAGYVGTDTFTYTVTSGGVNETTTVTVNVTNTAPTPLPDVAQGNEDRLQAGNVLTNDRDLDGDTLKVVSYTVAGDSTVHAAGTAVTIAGKGSLTLLANGVWLFNPVNDWNGTLPVITYTLTDGNSNGVRSSTLTITVQPVQDAFDDSATTHAGNPVDTDVLANDTFSNPNAAISAWSNGTHGTVTLVNGELRYTPDAGYVGNDTYTYTVTSAGITETATVHVTVTDTVPQAVDDLNLAQEDHVLSGNVLVNDSDPDNDPLTVTQFTVNGQTANAGDTLTITGVGTFTLRADGSYSLSPIADWNGIVPRITYTVSDGNLGGTSSAALLLGFLPVQDAIDDSASTHANQPISIDVLANDTFSNSDKTLSGFTQGSHGSVRMVNGQLVYTPASGFVGQDTFTYTVTSGGVKETATVTLAVTNSVPIVTPKGAITGEGVPVGGNLLDNSRDPDGDRIFVQQFTVKGETFAAGQSVTLAGQGRLTINRDGSWRFVPEANYSGVVPLVTWRASDGNDGGTATSLLRIAVTPVVNITVRESSLTSGDLKGSEVVTSVQLVSLTPINQLSFNGTVLSLARLQQLSENPLLLNSKQGLVQLFNYVNQGDTGLLSYRFILQHALNQPGVGQTSDTITWHINGNNDQVGGVLTITVIDDVPTAHSNSAEIVQDRSEESAQGNLFNDDRIGADGPAANGPVTAVKSDNTGRNGVIDGNTQGEYGTLRLDKNGNWQYELDRNNSKVAALDASASLTEVFTYTITDSDGDTSTATLTVTIYGTTPPITPSTDSRFISPWLRYDDGSQPQTSQRLSYQPALFILPMIYDQDNSASGRSWAAAQSGYGLTDASAPVLQNAVLFEGMLAEQDRARRETPPTLSGNGLGENLLWDAFSPFSVAKAAERDKAHHAHPATHPEQRGAPSLSAQLKNASRAVSLPEQIVITPPPSAPR